MAKNKLDFIHVCESAFLSKETNNLNIIGIFNNIMSLGTPAVHPKMAIAFGMTVEAGGHKVAIKILSPSKTVIAELKNDFIQEEGATNFQSILNFVNFVFPEYGVYKIDVFLDETIIGQTQLDIKKV